MPNMQQQMINRQFFCQKLLINKFYINSSTINNYTSMADQNNELGWCQHSILHQTKDKYKQLASSLLLTSSLISHKHKISQLRKEKAFSHNIPSCQGLLKTSKMGLKQTKIPSTQPHKLLSNIQELKFLARKLQQDQVTKLGKQNKSEDLLGRESQRVLYEIQITNNSSNYPSKRHNKRKIVKGRPEMFAMIKKRKFLSALTSQGKPLQNISNQPNFRQSINELLNKNNLLKYITTKNQLAMEANLYQNLLKQKQQLYTEPQCSNIRTNLRRNSAASFNNMEKTNYLQKQTIKDRQNQNERFPDRHFSLAHKRYSVSHTIQ